MIIRYRISRVGRKIRIEDGGELLYTVSLTKDNVGVRDEKSGVSALLVFSGKGAWQLFFSDWNRVCDVIFPRTETLHPVRPLRVGLQLDDGTVEVKTEKDGGLILHGDTVIGSISNLYSKHGIFSLDNGMAGFAPVLLAMAYAIYLSDGISVV